MYRINNKEIELHCLLDNQFIYTLNRSYIVMRLKILWLNKPINKVARINFIKIYSE